MTGYDPDTRRELAGSEVLRKPFAREELLNAVRRMLDANRNQPAAPPKLTAS